MPVAQPKHEYTIELHRAVYSDDLFQVYKAYEQDVHGKERDEEFLKGHLCNSPMFDPQNEDDQAFVSLPAVRDGNDIDKAAERVIKEDEGVLPGDRG